MSEKTVKTRIQQKHDFEVNWIAAGSSEKPFVPMKGELIVYDAEADAEGNLLSQLPTGRTTPFTYERVKIGDGLRNVTELPFISNAEIGEGKGAVQQVADGVSDGFAFTGKNGNAAALDADVEKWNNGTEKVPYGATGQFAAAFGGKSSAQGKRSMAVGTTTIAKGNYSFAAGDNSVAVGNDSAVFGYQNTAKGQASFAAGSGTQATGDASASFGKDTIAEGMYSFAAGYQAVAKDQASVSLGKGTIAQNGATVVGKYNKEEPSALFAVGCGSATNRQTAFTVWRDGSLYSGSGPNDANSNYLTTRDDVDYLIETAGTNYWKIPNVPEGMTSGTRIPIQSITDGEVSAYGTLNVAKSWAGADTIVQRNEVGQILVADPTEDNHAATKKYVDTAIDSIELTDDKVKLSAEIQITEPFGLYTIPTSGSRVIGKKDNGELMTFRELFISAYQKEDKEGLQKTNPSVAISTSNQYVEVGTTVTPNIAASFSDGEYKYGPEPTGVTATTSTYKFTNNKVSNEEITGAASGKFADYTFPVEPTEYRVTVTVDHTAGSAPVSNTGNEYSAQAFSSGTKTAIKTIYTSYKPNFYGYKTITNKLEAVDSTTITSDIIRGLGNNQKETSTAKSSVKIGEKWIQFFYAVPAGRYNSLSAKDSNNVTLSVDIYNNIEVKHVGDTTSMYTIFVINNAAEYDPTTITMEWK